METADGQQAECSISRHRLTSSLSARGTRTRQMGRSTRSPLQSLSAAQEAALAPRLDSATAPHRPPVFARLKPNRDTRSSNRSPSPDGPGPRTFVQNPQQTPLPPRSEGGQGKGKTKRRDQDEGPSTQRGKRIERIITDRPTPRWSPRLIMRARSPSRALPATSTSSWRAHAPTMTTP